MEFCENFHLFEFILLIFAENLNSCFSQIFAINPLNFLKIEKILNQFVINLAEGPLKVKYQNILQRNRWRVTFWFFFKFFRFFFDERVRLALQPFFHIRFGEFSRNFRFLGFFSISWSFFILNSSNPSGFSFQHKTFFILKFFKFLKYFFLLCFQKYLLALSKIS